MPKGYGGDEYSDEDVRRLRKALGASGQAATNSGQTAAPRRGAVKRRKGYSDDGLGDTTQQLSDKTSQGDD